MLPNDNVKKKKRRKKSLCEFKKNKIKIKPGVRSSRLPYTIYKNI